MDKKPIPPAIADELEKLRKLSDRFHREQKRDTKGKPDKPFQEDYRRILYSSSFRRLQGKMQLLGFDPANFYRNRLTHSLEVAHIAKSICLKLNKKYDDEIWQSDELCLIEAISLAHDLGNPPFGHAGERVLDGLVQEYGGFEGNAQTIRIVNTLERRYPTIEGLNLTKRTVMGLVKYFHKREEYNSYHKKFLYDQDYKSIAEIKDKFKLTSAKTLDCKIMDIADEIAYAAHDLEDALHLKHINCGDVLYLFENEMKNSKTDLPKGKVKKAKEVLEKIFTAADAYAKRCNPRYTSDDPYETVLVKEITSAVINLLIYDVDCNEAGGIAVQYRNYEALSKGIDTLLFKTIKNQTENILQYERRGEKILKGLYEVFTDTAFNKENELLGSVYRDFEKDKCKERKRQVIDYLAGMTDTFAKEQYFLYFGANPFEDGIYTDFHRKKK